MEEDAVSFAKPQGAVYELWCISTYCYSAFGMAREADFDQDAMREPLWNFKDRFWSAQDMEDCARSWCNWKAGIQKEAGSHNPTSLWTSFKHEFWLFACTNDKKYKTLRSETSKMAGQKSQLAICSTVASGLALHVGVPIAAVLTPLCAVCFLAGCRIGQELLCNWLSQQAGTMSGVKLGHELRPPEVISD